MRFLTLAASLALLTTPAAWGSEVVPDLSYSRLFGPNAHTLDTSSVSTSTSAPTSADWTTGYGFTTNNVIATSKFNATLPLPPHTLNQVVIQQTPAGPTPVVVPLPAGEIYSTGLIFGAATTSLATIPLSGAGKRNAFSRKYNNTAFTSVSQFPKVGAGLLTSIDVFDDEFFGITRFAGPNPTLIRKITAISPKFGDIATLRHKVKTLNSLLKNGQIYELDYFKLAHVANTALAAPDNSILQYPQNPNPGAQQRYLTAPYVILQSVPEDGRSKLVPIAIQLGQTYVKGSTAILYRADYKNQDGTPKKHVNQGDWNYAKTIVNAADSVIHELEAHLLKTHLIEENVIIGTHVKLPQTHVISRLLIKDGGHSLKTLQLNEDARNSLLPGVVDEVFAGGYGGVGGAGVLVDTFFAQYDWVADYVPNDLTARGFNVSTFQTITADQQTCLQANPNASWCLRDCTADGLYRYTYAQDAVDSWYKLSTFVGTVLQAQYADDQAVAQDQDLQAWAAYLSTPQLYHYTQTIVTGPLPPVPGFPASFTTLQDLTNAVTSALYKATVGHSVVNYPQTFYNAYIPVYPALALYQPILNATTVGTGLTTDAYIASALGNANTQEVMTILANGLGQPVASSGLVDDITLLQYATSAAAAAPADPTDAVAAALYQGAQQLLSDLQDSQTIIQNRNNANPAHYQYSYFDPSLVANAIFA